MRYRRPEAFRAALEQRLKNEAETGGERLSHALEATFAQRASQPLPDTLPPPPRSWARPYAELAREAGVPPDLDSGHAAAADLLDPVLASRAAGRWNPRAGRWT